MKSGLYYTAIVASGVSKYAKYIKTGLIVSILLVCVYCMYPNSGTCTLVGYDDIAINNPCKRLLVQNNMCMFVALTNTDKNCINKGNNYDECIRLYGMKHISDCMFVHTSVPKLYDSCMKEINVKDIVARFNDLVNYTDTKYQYVYNFKNDKYDINITRSKIMYYFEDNEITSSDVMDCYYFPFGKFIHSSAYIHRETLFGVLTACWLGMLFKAFAVI